MCSGTPPSNATYPAPRSRRRAGVEHGGAGRRVRVERPDEVRVVDVGVPVEVQRRGRTPQPVAPPTSGGVGQGPDDAHLAVQHDLGGAHPGEQRDLRVPLLDRAARRGRPATIRRRSTTTSCSGSGRLTPPRSRSRAQPQHADLLEQHEDLVGRCRRRSPPARPRSRACAAADQGALDVDSDRPRRCSSRSIVHSSAGRTWSGSRLAAPSDSTGGCSGIAVVGRVHRLAAAVRLDVDRAPRARRRQPRRRSRSAPGSRRRRRSMCSAWSRSFEPAGSIVTNGMSVRSSSGSFGLAAASSAAASTSGGNSCGTSCSARSPPCPR